MSRGRRAERVFPAAAAGLLLMGAAVLYGWLHTDSTDLPCIVSLAAQTADCRVTGEQAAQMKSAGEEQNMPAAFTVWEETAAERITAINGLRSTTVSAVAIRGSSEYLVPYGRFLHEEDTEGCLLGTDAAIQLFGSRNAEGLTVCLGERELTVRGMLHEYKDVLIYQEPDETALFSRINLWCEDDSRAPDAAAERFVSGNGLNMIRVSGGTESLWDELAGLVPGKWSDFAGWRVNIENWMQERKERRRIPPDSFRY